MRTSLLVLAALALGFAPAPLPRPDRGKGERNRLAGTWVLKQVKHVGHTGYTGAGVGTGVIHVSEEVTFSERELHVKDPKAVRQPRRLVIEVQTGAQHIDFFQRGDHRAHGLYRVEGDTLTICYPTGTG